MEFGCVGKAGGRGGRKERGVREFPSVLVLPWIKSYFGVEDVIAITLDSCILF
jgi:hypothetical protein